MLMSRPKSIAEDSKQLLYARLCKLQTRTSKNRLRILQIATQLDRVQKFAAKDPGYASAPKLIPQLEKMLQLARAMQEYDRAVLNHLWRELG